MTSTRRRYASLIAFGLSILVAACGGDGIVLPNESRPAKIAIVDGDGQSAPAGATLTQPIVLLQLAANVAGFVMALAAVHILRVNTTLLPPPLRPPLWRRVALVSMSVFYSGFLWLWLMGGLVPDRATGFLFSLLRR